MALGACSEISAVRPLIPMVGDRCRDWRRAERTVGLRHRTRRAWWANVTRGAAHVTYHVNSRARMSHHDSGSAPYWVCFLSLQHDHVKLLFAPSRFTQVVSCASPPQGSKDRKLAFCPSHFALTFHVYFQTSLLSQRTASGTTAAKNTMTILGTWK